MNAEHLWHVLDTSGALLVLLAAGLFLACLPIPSTSRAGRAKRPS